MERDINSILQKLIKSEPVSAHTPPEDKRRFTSLGVHLEEREDGSYFIDLTDIKVFSGLSVFARSIANEVMEQCGFGIADIMVRRRVDNYLTPELAELGVEWAMLYARTDAAESLPWHHEKLDRYLRLVFNAIQTARWGGVLFPEFFHGKKAEQRDAACPALLFPFHLYSGEENDYYFLLEYNRAGHFIRITIEKATESRLQLKHIRHRVVDNLGHKIYLPDIQLIADRVRQGIVRECHNFRAEYKENAEECPDLFGYLRRLGLTDLSLMLFKWPQDLQEILLENKTEADGFLAKIFLLLEDPEVIRVLAHRKLLEMRSGSFRSFWDVSRHDRCLNISLKERRAHLDLKAFLDDMPSLNAAVRAAKSPLRDVRLFLIHHITAEVLGLIRAFQVLGCPLINTLFVKYSGLVPDVYLETLLSLPESLFRFYGLQKVSSNQSLKERYVMSREYSHVKELDTLDSILRDEDYDFLGAMRLAAGHLFFLEAMACRITGEKLLLVEDGGYLAPLINRFCLENKTLKQTLEHFCIKDFPQNGPKIVLDEDEMEMSLAAWLEKIFPGSVEHTRNGFDYNQAVMERFGRLQYPVCSIAVSNLKRGEEARECSFSIINAVESIFNRLGMIFSRRFALVIGSRGAIAANTIADLAQRMGPDRVIGVDIAVVEGQENTWREFPDLESVDRASLHKIDLIIGIVGKSVMKKEVLEEMLLSGAPRSIFFASGSTKTVEFKDIEVWLNQLHCQKSPEIRGKAVRLSLEPLRDLQTGVRQATRVNIFFEDPLLQAKHLYLLGDLTPINFLYYGIPREIIDQVMCQLMKVSLGLIDKYSSGVRLPSRLLAVDCEIDVNANLIQ